MRNLVKMILVNNNLCVAETQVTQGLFEEVMGWNPTRKVSPFSRPTPHRCVKDVSWLEAVLFCNKLSELEGLQQAYFIDPFTEEVWGIKGANGYRLPTEAEAKVLVGNTFGGLLTEMLVDVNYHSLNSLGLKGVNGGWEWTSSNGRHDGTKTVYSGDRTLAWDFYASPAVTFRVVRSR